MTCEISCNWLWKKHMFIEFTSQMFVMIYLRHTCMNTQPDGGVLSVKCICPPTYSDQHYNDFIMSAMVSQITSLTIVYSTVYSGADQRKKTKLCVTGLCKGNTPVTGEFPAQRAINAKNVPIWWHHYELCLWDSYNSACIISPKCIANYSIYLIYRRCGISTVNGLLNICFALNILQSSPTNITIVI